MKTIGLSLLVMTLSASGPLYAQRIFSEGMILYDVRVDEPLNLRNQGTVQFSGSKMELMVNSKMSRTDLIVGAIDRVVIRNAADTTAVAMIDRGPEKYLMRLTPAMVKNELAVYAGMKFQDGHTQRKIAGYNCLKAVGKTRAGNTVTVFYTPDLVPGNPDYFPEFVGLKGVPLEFRTRIGGLKMIMTASQVNLTPQPASEFDIPTSGYKIISEEELQDMTNG
ncbi:MAG TPA: hypothetical protein VNE41_00240 [Chitinophagaceae bacterium]|nr:hypothetical protein [Chitinophagaceae bacterium]